MSAAFDWSAFIEAPGFLESWHEAGCNDIDLRALQLDLLLDPTGWPVVPTTGGWRKARFAPPSWGKGKSGGLRVYYAHLPNEGYLILGTAFRKVDKSDLSPAAKKYIAAILPRIVQVIRGDD